MVDAVIGFCVGFAFAWGYIEFTGLKRSRSEWYAHRKAMGKKVPDNWEDDDAWTT